MISAILAGELSLGISPPHVISTISLLPPTMPYSVKPAPGWAPSTAATAPATWPALSDKKKPARSGSSVASTTHRKPSIWDWSIPWSHMSDSRMKPYNGAAKFSPIRRLLFDVSRPRSTPIAMVRPDCRNWPETPLCSITCQRKVRKGAMPSWKNVNRISRNSRDVPSTIRA